MIYDTFFYPHILQLKSGNSWIDKFNCGEQPNGAGRTVNTVERTDYIYASLVFFPNTEDYLFIPGEEIRIMDVNGVIRVSGKIARYDVGRLEDNRIWI